MSNSLEGKVVCVTGASGYIASWLVKLLLERGYTVNATVRDPNDPKKVEHLRSLDGAKDRLHLFAANLVEEGSFDAAVEGCDAVFHTASPAYVDFAEDPQVELIDPAVKGTLNVLNSCAKFSSVKRVILTSSMAAVMHDDKPLGPEVVVDETWYSDPDFCRKTELWYFLSKILAEDAAWKFVKDKKFDMVSINPAVVIGPLLQPSLNSTSGDLAKLFNESGTYPNITFSWVHVKDVAEAHILALEVPSANGRYCLAGFVAHYWEIIKILRELYPDVAFANKCADNDDPFGPHQISQEKTRSLGIDYIPLKTGLKETVDSLNEKGFISI